jgi:hypothetical protein
MNTAKQMYALDIPETADLITMIGKDQTVIAVGSMGQGKSAILDIVAKELPTHKPFYFDCTTKVDAGDMGLPRMKEAQEKDFFTHAVAEELGFHHDGPIILMLDEIGKNKSLLPALQRIAYEKKFGMHELHPDSIVFATTNKASEGMGDVLSALMRNRTTVVTIRKTTNLKWLEWAIDNDIEPLLMGYVKDHPELGDDFEDIKDPQENLKIYHPKDPSRQSFWTWRSGEAASKILKKRHMMSNHMLTAALIGTIGEQAAVELMTFVNVAKDMPSADDIKNDPKNAKVPSSAAAVCMTVFRTLSTIDRDWMDAWMTYMDRLDTEAQGLFVNGARSEKYSKRNIVMQNKKFGEWSRLNGYMFQADKV